MFHVACMDWTFFINCNIHARNEWVASHYMHACMVDAYRYIMMYMHAMCMYLNITHMLHTYGLCTYQLSHYTL